MTASPIPLETRTFGGVEVEMRQCGSGPAALFLHSGEGPVAINDEYLRLLGESMQVTALTHPGFMHSSLPNHYRTIGDLALFYLDVLDELGQDPVLLIGASFGGWIAAEVAIRNTSHLSGLVLIDPLGIKVGGRDERDILDLHVLGREERLAAMYHDPANGTRDFAAMTVHERQGIARSREAELRFGWEPYMYNPSLLHWLHRIDVPTLVLRGNQDRVVSQAYHQAFADAIPAARLAIIPEAGHYAHLEQAAAVCEQTVAFPRRHAR